MSRREFSMAASPCFCPFTQCSVSCDGTASTADSCTDNIRRARVAMIYSITSSTGEQGRRNFEADHPWGSAMWRGRGSSVESLLELRDGPRLDEAQADFRLLASSHTRLEKSIILASAVSCQNHPQRIVDVGGVAAMF